MEIPSNYTKHHYIQCTDGFLLFTDSANITDLKFCSRGAC